MKILILFFLSGVLCELLEASSSNVLPETYTKLPDEQNKDSEGITVVTNLPVYAETLTDLPGEQIKDFDGKTVVTDLPVYAETLTDLPGEQIKDFEGKTLVTELPVYAETLTDLPGEQIKDFEGDTVVIEPVERDTELTGNKIKGLEGDGVPARQNDLEVELEKEEEALIVIADEVVSSTTAATTTVHFTTEACIGEHMEWHTCGPRCYQTCVIQPRTLRRQKRAVCEANSATNCYPGCFCKTGYVRLNKKCVLSTECPSKA